MQFKHFLRSTVHRLFCLFSFSLTQHSFHRHLMPINLYKRTEKSTDKSKLFLMYSICSNGNRVSISFSVHAWFKLHFFRCSLLCYNQATMLKHWIKLQFTHFGFRRLQQRHTAKTDTRVAKEMPEMIITVRRSSDESIVAIYIGLMFLLYFRNFLFSPKVFIKFYRFWADGFLPFLL